MVFDNKMDTATPVAGEDACDEPGDYGKEWAFPQTAQTTPISYMGNWRMIACRAFFGGRKETNRKRRME